MAGKVADRGSLIAKRQTTDHSGKGGGLSDMFGGGMGGSAAGSTVVERNLDRITVATAIIFAFTTVILAIRIK